MLFKSNKFSVDCGGGGARRFDSLVVGLISTYVAMFAAVSDLHFPFFTAVIPIDPFMTSCVSGGFLLILVVFLLGCFSEVYPSVVSRFSVDVVDSMLRPIPGHYYPDYAMREQRGSVYTDVPVTDGGKASGLFASGSHFPPQDSGLLIVCENLSEVISGRLVRHA